MEQIRMGITKVRAQVHTDIHIGSREWQIISEAEVEVEWISAAADCEKLFQRHNLIGEPGKIFGTLLKHF